MSNNEIIEENRAKLSDLITAKFDVDTAGDVSTKFDYNHIETVSMISFINRDIYDKILTIKSNIIFDNERNLFFCVKFDPLIFYENSNLKVK